MNMKKTFQILSIVLVIGLLLASCANIQNKVPSSKKYKIIETSQDLKKFSSIEELKKFLKDAQSQQGIPSYYRGGVFMEKSMATSPSAMTESAITSSGGASDYSQTNIQVAGVDEADFVKNDNKYIYTLTGNKLVIVNAYPAENAKIISETEIKGSPQNLFVDGNRLVVFTVDNENRYQIQEYDFVPRPVYSQRTHAIVYDITDKASPKIVNDFSISGNYFQSRMIGNYVYFIVSDGVNYYDELVNVPTLMESKATLAAPELYYFDNPEYGYNFNTIASFNINDDSNDINAKTFMMGYANNLYVSNDNIYITYQKNLPYIYYKQQNEGRFYEVVLPLLPNNVQVKINEIKNDNSISDSERWGKISSVLEDMYNTMDENDKQDLIEEIQKSIEEYEIKQEVERRKTVIQKIGINNGEIEYKKRGEVPGYVLNQFSMDESNGYFRIATTTEIWTSKSIMYNNVFVLDESLNTIGKLEDIAPDEKIYSTRFLGDRLYMVTFKRIDPLFVIDLSNPAKPEILGKLKIPGYSDYLHPYDESHIIGIGKETEGNEFGGVSTKGIKLALFDVSDVANPKQVDSYEIGDQGSDSEVLYDHKAFLFDKEKNILVLPVREVKGRQYNEKYGYYDWSVWRGAYVFGVNPETGFEKKGKVTHVESENENDMYGWWTSPDAIRRSLFMDDVLYTISSKKIKANDLNDISTELKEIILPYEQNTTPYPKPIPMMNTGVVSVEEATVSK